MKSYLIGGTLLSATLLLKSCGSSEVVPSTEIQPSRVYHSLNVTNENDEERYLAVFREGSIWGASIELMEPASIKVGDEPMESVNAETTNAALSVLIPIPFLFLGLPGQYYNLKKDAKGSEDKVATFVYTDQEDKTKEISVERQPKPEFTGNNKGKEFSLSKGIELLTDVKYEEENNNVSCVLKSEEGAEKSHIKSASTRDKDGVFMCYWPRYELDEIPTGKYTISLSRSFRKKLPDSLGYVSYTAIGDSVDITLAK